MMKRGYVASLLTLSIAAFVACGDSEPTLKAKTVATNNDAGTDLQNGIPFEPISTEASVIKVKNLLTGLPATDAEIAAVKADPNALKNLIDAWMTLPSFKVRMTDFFRNAFQQNQVQLQTLMDNMNIDRINFTGTNGAKLQRNLMDSFALTAWQIMYDGLPFNATLTTRRFQMTTAMASFVSYLDNFRTPDGNPGARQNRLKNLNPVASFSFVNADIAPTDTLDSTSPNFLKFSLAHASVGAGYTSCGTTEQMIPSGAGSDDFYAGLFNTIFGRPAYNPCNVMNGNGGFDPSNLYLTDADFNDWHWVTLSPITDDKTLAKPAFYEVTQLRHADKITVHADRIGFFSTPAFAANWATNDTNEMRVTANQALIVAAGQSIEGEDILVNFPVDATDSSHATNPACQGCHSQLDPYKNFFRQSFTEFYSEQADKTQVNSTAGYAIPPLNQAQKGGKGVSDLANIFASNPRFPIAWVAKLHFWANSLPAIETDPEVLRVAQAFTSSSFDFKTLIRELFSSPLITWSAETQTTSKGIINSIARRDQLCAALSNRLQLNDICGMLSTNLPGNDFRNGVRDRAQMLATDTYFRAYALPSLPTSPDLFFRESTETICSIVADQTVGNDSSSKYNTGAPDDAINDMVSNIMSIPPSDARYAQAKAILTDNFTQASTVGGVDKATALKATFQLACLAPSSVMIGL